MNKEFHPPSRLDTPVLFIVYKRFETTIKVFEAIRKAKPPRLYISSDGPKKFISEEKNKIKCLRQHLLKSIDWDCEVKTKFQNKNMGCRNAVTEGISWFFSHEEKGIILEDDTLPSQSFFWFCEELLERYQNDYRVGQISGFNYGYENRKMKYDYFYSKYVQIWGWATWKRAWEKIDLQMKTFEEAKDLGIFNILFKNHLEKIKRRSRFQRTKNGEIDSWGYLWSYSSLLNAYYSIIPKYNLIENIGFGEGATHTTGNNLYLNNKKNEFYPIKKHPEYIVQDEGYYSLINRNLKLVEIYKIIKNGFIKRNNSEKQ